VRRNFVDEKSFSCKNFNFSFESDSVASRAGLSTCTMFFNKTKENEILKSVKNHTVCMVPLKKGYNSADAKCQSYGMSLYDFDTSEAKRALLAFSNSRFKPSKGEVLFVKGSKKF
jgi:hypothetical protein